MKYTISLSKEAIKELDRIDRKIEKRIQKRLDDLVIEPYSYRISHEVIMAQGRRYYKVGDWRIIYEVVDDLKIVKVSAIQHRSRVYKELKK